MWQIEPIGTDLVIKKESESYRIVPDTKEKEMSTITKADLIQKLMDKRGAEMVTVVSETVPNMTKTIFDDSLGSRIPNPFYGATKTAKFNGTLNPNYEASVNRQRGREDKPMDFEADAPKWGERIVREDGTLTPIVVHTPKGETEPKYYVILHPGKSFEREYSKDGVILSTEDVEKVLPEKSEGNRQQVDKKIIHRRYSIDSIKHISLGGIVYEVV
jgi:hypothetical protein